MPYTLGFTLESACAFLITPITQLFTYVGDEGIEETDARKVRKINWDTNEFDLCMYESMSVRE
jgi:hypothetical protein